MFESALPLCARRGAVLLVIVMMLTLFAVVGLSFVMYADSAARSARHFREAQAPQAPDVDPEFLLSWFLGQLLYDVPDDEAGVYSALRGHSLARNLYGGNGGPGPVLVAQPAANVVPFNGVGRLHAESPFGSLVPGPEVDDRQLVNYTFYRDDPQLPPGQRFLRDPERLGWRPPDLTAPRGVYAGGSNVPYTYPDLNTLFLAAMRADGAVLLPSFHRPWTADVPGSPDGAGEFFDRATGKLNPFWASDAKPPPWFKYTTLRPLPALNPGFPPPEDGGGDVKNLIGGPGTFRRLNGPTPEYWNNDSFWMDLGFPVMTMPDGRRYKPLFAALVTDLDNRVNVNVHGNTVGGDRGHRSNQGLGPWEVNPGRVLTAGGGTEWRNLLLGTAAPAQVGRQGGAPWAGQAGTPGAPGGRAPPGRPMHFYSELDFDGGNETTGGPSGPLLLPGFGAPPFSPFPSFLTPAGGDAGYGNGSAPERRGHPLLFNPFRPAGDDRTFALSNLEALLRYGDTGSAALTSDLFRLCPDSFQDPRTRRLVTTHSVDLDRPGLSPWVHFGPSGSEYDVGPTVDPDRPPAPEGPAIAFPALARGGTPPYDPRQDLGEFGGVDGRAVSAALGRINLSRPLPPYPHMGSGDSPPFGSPLTVRGGKPALDVPFTVDAPNGPVWQQFVRAQQARQQLASEIYRRLLVVTGVPPIRDDQNPQAPPPALLRVRRWLAQLAVNVVDFIDEDDISTPFCFYTTEDYKHLATPPSAPPDPGRTSRPDNPGGGPVPAGEIQWPLYWVFGTELPRLVVNEALAQAGQNDPDQAYKDMLRVFVELHNPFPRTLPANTYAPDRFPVPLRMGSGSAAYTPYRLVLGVKSPVPNRPTGVAVLPTFDNDNVLGNPDPAAVRAATTTDDFLSPAVLLDGGAQQPWPETAGYAALPAPHVPAHGADTDTLPQGFLLLGPPVEAPAPFPDYDPFGTANSGAIPPATPVVRTPSLTYSRFFPVRQRGDRPDERSEGVTVLLRRLANPYLPFDGRRLDSSGTGPNFTYNPYVTVDYLEDILVQPVVIGLRPPLTARGRLQPYTAHRSQLLDQTVAAGNLSHTFGRQNVPVPERYDWLTHLDRPPTSPLELLQVAGCQPYQLTQQFVSADAAGQVTRFGHRAPWLDPGRAPGASSHCLYRLFEFLGTGPLSAGVAAGGRVPGKINLNTVWDPEILRALCDAQPANYFQDADVDRLFSRFVYDPRPDAAEEPLRRTPGLIPGPDDRPFRELAVGTYPAGDPQVRTADGSADSFLRLQPEAAGVHPYTDSQLLTKVYNHLTTRSNLFAVWLTVGFFEVTDETGRPVRVGAEIGRAENRHKRHRLFAVLDRTNLSIASCVSELLQPVPAPPPAPYLVSPRTVPVRALRGPTTLSLTGPTLDWAIRPGSTLVIDVGAAQETVLVLAVNDRANPPMFTAAFSRAHAAGAAVALADTPGAPPVFLKPVAVTRLPTSGSAPPYDLAVTVTVDPRRSSSQVLAGEYEGVPWRLEPGTPLLLNGGTSQEVVTVQPRPFALNLPQATGTFRVVVTKEHAEGFTIANTLLGNPGPRPRFHLGDPLFNRMVRYRSVIQ
jgi:hypothetical protein